jgi:hypothetical protein
VEGGEGRGGGRGVIGRRCGYAEVRAGAEEGVGKRRDPARASRPKASDCASGFGREVMAHRRHTFMSATSSGSYWSAVRARQA